MSDPQIGSLKFIIYLQSMYQLSNKKYKPYIKNILFFKSLLLLIYILYFFFLLKLTNFLLKFINLKFINLNHFSWINNLPNYQI